MLLHEAYYPLSKKSVKSWALLIITLCLCLHQTVFHVVFNLLRVETYVLQHFISPMCTQLRKFVDFSG